MSHSVSLLINVIDGSVQQSEDQQSISFWVEKLLGEVQNPVRRTDFAMSTSRVRTQYFLLSFTEDPVYLQGSRGKKEPPTNTQTVPYGVLTRNS